MAYLDPIFSFVMSFIMAMINLPVITNCISILLLNKPVLEVVKSKIEQLPEVSAITDIYIMQRTGGDEVLNVDVIAKRPDTQHKISI
jgi:Co/Zn/Cd efflux system component